MDVDAINAHLIKRKNCIFLYNYVVKELSQNIKEPCEVI